MKNISEVVTKKQRPERVIQFGEGGFLRGFVDWMLQKLNESGSWDGSVVIVQPIEKGMCDVLSAQNCVYTHVMRGLENGSPVVRLSLIHISSRTAATPVLLLAKSFSSYSVRREYTVFSIVI